MRDIVVMMAFLGLVPMAIMRPFIGFLIWTWFTLMSPHREAFGFAQNFQFNMIIAAVTFFGLLMSQEKIKVQWHRGNILLFLWFGFTVFTTFFALQPEYSYVFFKAMPLKSYIYIILLVLLVHKEEHIIALLWMIAVSLGYYGVSIGLVGILEGGKNLGISADFGPVGTLIQDRNHMALAFCMLIPVLVYLGKYVQNLLIKKMIWGCIFLTILAIFVSYSRGGWVCLMFIGLQYFWTVKNKWIYLIAGLFISLTASLFLTQEWHQRMDFSNVSEDASFNGRLEAWYLSKEIADQNPWTGGGFRAVQSPEVFKKYQYSTKNIYPKAAHSIYFEVLGDHGYVGLFLFLILILYSLWTNRKTKKYIEKYSDLSWVYDLVTALNISIMAYCLAGAALSMAYYELFYIVVALSFIINKMVITHINKDKKKNFKFEKSKSSV